MSQTFNTWEQRKGTQGKDTLKWYVWILPFQILISHSNGKKVFSILKSGEI